MDLPARDRLHAGLPPHPRTALILSAGAMFGAYQAGVWQALEGRFQPDVIIGASVGSLNGWAIAGGMSADSLADRWLALPEAARIRPRFPRRLLDGFVDASYLQRWIQELHLHLQPRCEFALVMTRVLPLQSELILSPHITWQHLANSCAMPLLFPHYRIQGVLYTDGGLLQALPLWAATTLHCQRVIAVNLLPTVPFWGGNLAKRILRRCSRHSSPPPPPSLLLIQPRLPLGNVRDFLVWSQPNAIRWITQGRADARLALEQCPFPLSDIPSD